MKLNGSFDSPSGITVSPLERPCVRVVVANILHDFSFEICFRREDPSCDKVPLYFRKPYLDLVEPGTVGRSIVHVHIGVFAQEQLDAFGLMGGEIVGDDMDLFTLRLRTHQVGEEGHELGAGMTIGGFADDGSSGGIQCRIQRDGPVTVVLESVPFGSSGRKRQDRIKPVERLDGGLFIDTEDRGMGRGLQIQTNDFGRFALKIRIGAELIATQSVRLQTGLGPHPCDSHVRATQFPGQSTCAPVSRSICWFAVQGPVNDTRFKFFGARFGLPSFVPAVKPPESLISKALFPEPHRVHTATDFSSYFSQAATTHSLKNDPGSSRVLAPSRPAAHGAVEFATFWRANNQSIFHTRHNTASVS